MPEYAYVAKGLDAKTVRGTHEAVDAQQLADWLREQNLFLLKYRERAADQQRGYRLKATELADFSRQVGTMLASGIPLTRAVSILLQRPMKEKVAKVYTEIYRSLQRGHTLSQAMAEQSGSFPELMINMFRAGESSGRLDKTAIRMADFYDKEHRLHNKIRGALTYPAILLVLTVVVVIGMFTLILPQFFSLFEGLDTLPLPTRIVLAISDFMSHNWLYVIIGILIAVAGISMLLRLPRVHLIMDRLKLRLPKAGKLLGVIYTARFARTLSSLYVSGLTMINALQIAARTVGNQYINSQFPKVVRLVRDGKPLSASIAQVDGFDAKLSSIIFVGEESGKLDDMLESVADTFDYESEAATQRLVSILEPLLIVLMALIIGSIMISVILPLMQLYNSIG